MMQEDPGLVRLLSRIHDQRGMDFTQYKERSIIRRIRVRMRRHNVASYNDYIGILDSRPEEYQELMDTLTINVTEFFRNPESFRAIEDIVIPRVLFAKRRHRHKIIRVWSCGCSSGDEPFSLAILLLEKLGEARSNFLLTIIGSDIDKGALEEARNTVYSASRLGALDQQLLDKYFDPIQEGQFRLKSPVKSLVRFREHDVIKNAPFMHCDIILCRNLMIYFNKELQEEILLKFYQCLNPGGFLVLGMVETLVGSAMDVFEKVDNVLRIYRRPETTESLGEKGEVLSQKDVDRIVQDMLEEEAP